MSELQQKVEQVVAVLTEAVHDYAPLLLPIVWAQKIWC